MPFFRRDCGLHPTRYGEPAKVRDKAKAKEEVNRHIERKGNFSEWLFFFFLLALIPVRNRLGFETLHQKKKRKKKLFNRIAGQPQKNNSGTLIFLADFRRINFTIELSVRHLVESTTVNS